jgi:low affinity Fe/Cu permease
VKKILEIGGTISCWVADLAGNPIAQIAVMVFCAAWFIVGGQGSENTLTLILSVSAITLTQMVLNQQKRNEAALHLKIDELIFSGKNARDEIAGIEGSTEAELEALRRVGNKAEGELKDRAELTPSAATAP